MISLDTMYAHLGFTVTTGTVKALDNGGEDCQYCSAIGAVVTHQIYYRLDGQRELEEGCDGCMFARMIEINQLGVDTFHVETEDE